MGNDLSYVLEKLQVLEKMYQTVRIVDPLAKKVLALQDHNLKDIKTQCFELWKKNRFCENCVSMRAIIENETIFKIELRDNIIYMITAVPITINGRKLVAEFIKEATSSLILHDNRLDENFKTVTLVEYLNKISVKDELTGLYNRRFINERLPVNLLHASEKKEPLSIIFTDLDFFKSINDNYGHAAGDKILKKVGDELQKHIDSSKDWIARYGGEEFLICLTNTPYGEAWQAAENMRVSIEKTVFTVLDQQVYLTCSFGVHTVCDEARFLSVDNIIDLADKKLYLAKSRGRNCVI